MSAINPGIPQAPPAAQRPGPVAGLRDNPTFTKILVIAGSVLATALTFRNNEGLRGLVSISLVGILYFLTFASPGLGVSGVILFLSLIGGIRRWLIPFLGYSNMDPLLLVNATIIGLYFASLLMQKKIPRETKLERLVMTLAIIMAVQVINPLQGGLAVGVAGCLFYLVPLLWFYIGAAVGSARVQTKVLGTVVFISVAAACYGLYQQWFGFSASEMEWLRVSRMLGGTGVGKSTIRVFSFFSSFSEYVYFLCIGGVICWAAFLRGNRGALILSLFFFGAVLLSSSRGAVVSILFTLAILWAFQGRTRQSWVPRLVIALVLGVAGLGWSLQEIKSAELTGPADDLLTHQTQLLDPFAASSTGGGHAELFFLGVLTGFTNPLGRGLGSTTIAAGKFGGTGAGTEVDISNLFTSLGFIGGIVYVVLIITVFSIASRQWMVLRDTRSLAVLGVLCVVLMQWLNGGHYAAVTLIWFLIGGMNRINRELQAQGKIPPEKDPRRSQAGLSPQLEAAARAAAAAQHSERP